jgi:hypothetical protein
MEEIVVDMKANAVTGSGSADTRRPAKTVKTSGFKKHQPKDGLAFERLVGNLSKRTSKARSGHVKSSKSEAGGLQSKAQLEAPTSTVPTTHSISDLQIHEGLGEEAAIEDEPRDTDLKGPNFKRLRFETSATDRLDGISSAESGFATAPFGIPLPGPEASKERSLSTETSVMVESEIRPLLNGKQPTDIASAVLAKLHQAPAWGVGVTESDDTASFSSKQKPKAKPKEKPKGKAEEKPAAPENLEKNEKVNMTRRERMIKEVQGQQASAKGDSKVRKSAGKSATGKRQTKAKPANATYTNAAASIFTDTGNETKAPEPQNLTITLPKDLNITPLDVPQPPVPGLEYDLDRVLFNPGVYQLQDPHSRVFNFDPYLQRIMPVVEFDYNALKEYKTSSQDVALAAIAKENNKRYIGSTSSMTGTLGHFHYLLSAFRPVNLDMLSRGFPDKLDTFTQINRAPNAIFLRWKDGTYAIDADKEYDGANVLMMLGKSMEKLLTLPTSEFERYRKSDPRSVSEEERTAPESYCYTTMGDFLMRSQLDAYDSRLPGTGMFDLKTRAVVSVRMNTDDFEPMTGYEIHTLQGRFESYEREYYDMIRSTMLKYMLQVRMGRMDGIFIAYHNVERIFGFQYVSLKDMDRALHGQINPSLGDQEFKLSLEMLNKVFDMATAKFPEQSLRFHIEASQQKLEGGTPTTMWIFAEPMSEEQIEEIQAKPKAKVQEFERTMMGIKKGENDVDEASSSDETVNEDTATSTSPTESAASAAMPEGSRTKAPLFAAVIMCKSEVNGDAVTRPERLKLFDKWSVEYFVDEWDPEENDKMWPMYEQMKARRRDLFARFDEGTSEEEEGAEVDKDTVLRRGKVKDKEKPKEKQREKKNKQYLDFLRGMSKQGREFRDRVEEMEKGKVPVVVGWKNGEVRAAEEEVDGVEGYMEWLYKR